MAHDHAHDPAEFFSKEYWNERYGSSDRVWSGEPNPHLVTVASDLSVGRALDIGSGEGADVIWLAGQGWTVKALDLSQVALDKAAALARSRGADVADRITWQQADLFEWQAEPRAYDLVSAQFMHLPKPAIFELQRRLAASVAPGGTLLIVGHHPNDERHSAEDTSFPDIRYTAEEVAALLDPEDWTIDATTFSRNWVNPDGEPAVALDAILQAVRR